MAKVSRGFACGIGIERIAMLLHDITDLRILYDNDVNTLRHYGQYPY